MNILENAINQAVANPNEMPDPIVLAIFQNDLRRAVQCASEYGLALRDLEQAIRHVGSKITGLEIKNTVKKWGKK